MESSSTDYENLENTANDSEIINIHEHFQCEGQVYTVQVADLKRLESWILALKLRYWIDFGNRSQYNVDWLRKLDDKGDLAGIRVKLFEASDEDSQGKLLFSISVCLHKKAISIEGKYGDLWKSNEFEKLQCFVSKLFTLSSTQDYQSVCQMYNTAFCQEDPQHNLSLDGVSLDIYNDSDDESDDKQEISDSQDNCKRTANVNPLRKTSAKSKRKSLSARHINTPSTNNEFNKRRRRVPKSYPDTNEENQSIETVLDEIKSIEKRMAGLEKVISKLDKTTSESDFEIKNINNTLSASKEQMSTFINSYLKHELAVIKSDQNSFIDEIHAHMNKVDKEMSKLRGRVGSLIEEKGSLLKKIKALEVSNQKMQDEIMNLHKDNHQSNQTEPHTITRPLPTSQQSTKEDEFQDTVKSSPASQHDNPDESTEPWTSGPSQGIMDHTKENIPTYEDSENQESKICEDFQNYDYVMLCDSNRRYLDTKKLLPKSSSKIIACSTTGKAIDIMNNPRFTINKGLIINTGVNDIDHMSTEDVIHSQVNLINTATGSFPGKKIILSSITPRNDSLDHKVKAANQEIHEQIKDIPNVFHVSNGNLRDDRFYHDTKHLNKRFGIPALAKNIKKEIRNAFYPRQNFVSKGNDTDVAQSCKTDNSRDGILWIQHNHQMVKIISMITQRPRWTGYKINYKVWLRCYSISSSHMVMSTNNSISG